MNRAAAAAAVRPNPTRLVRLRDVAEVTSGGPAPQGKRYFGGTNRFVRVQHLDIAPGPVTRSDLITDEAVRSYRLRLFPAGTIVLPKSGASIRLEKRAYLAEPSYLVSHLCAILPEPDVNQEFLFHALIGRRFAEGKADGYPTLTLTEIRDIMIHLPPLSDQKVIASTLGRLQKSRAASVAVARATGGLKRALLRYLFTCGPNAPADVSDVRLQRDRLSSPCPAHWRLSTLGEMAAVERGRFFHRPRNDPAYYGGSVPFIQTGDVTAASGADGHVRLFSQSLNELGLSVSRIFPRGTIAITIAANIGFSAILDFDSAFPDSIIGISPNDDLDARFLNYYLATQQSEMDRLAPRGTQKNINIAFLKPWPVLVPPMEEQRKIVAILEAVDAKVLSETRCGETLGRLLAPMRATLIDEEEPGPDV